MNRRELLCGSGLGLVAGAVAMSGVKAAASAIEEPAKPSVLNLADYQPKSTLCVDQSRVEKARYPVIDIHTHLSFAKRTVNGVDMTSELDTLAAPEELLAVMDRKNIRAMVNLTGASGPDLAQFVRRFDVGHPERFYTFTEPSYWRLLEPDYPRKQAEAIEQAHRDGARGLKIVKTLGLYLRDNITTGKLIQVDDPRFDPMWEVCGQLGMPVAIHVSDPVAFFSPIDRFNERFEELNNHPDWSFYGKDFPSNEALLSARNRMMARHPKTRFIVLHAGNFAEDLGHVSASMDKLPNMCIDIAARIGELGRQPKTARRFFERYQDRILFGTDAIPHGTDCPQQIFGEQLYEIYYRFLETDDEYFDYAPAPVPPQGRWRIYGIHLPDEVLRKVYNGNAKRELHLTA